MLLLDDGAEGRAQALKLRVEGEAGAASVFFDGEVAALLCAAHPGALRVPNRRWRRPGGRWGDAAADTALRSERAGEP
jgi:hypothetical protein